jgi:hypothetical protein
MNFSGMRQFDKKLSGFDNFPGAQTSGAYPDMHRITTLGGHSNFLQVREPAPPVLVMGMAYMITGYRSLATDFTFFCHDKNSLYK